MARRVGVSQSTVSLVFSGKGRGRVSDHPLGYALDLMARGAEGDAEASPVDRKLFVPEPTPL